MRKKMDDAEGIARRLVKIRGDRVVVFDDVHYCVKHGSAMELARVWRIALTGLLRRIGVRIAKKGKRK